MAAYDLSVLNDKEFEILGADIIAETFGVRVERFKPGRDAGVDGRWFLGGDNREIVIQCKHWIRSGFTKLLDHLNKVELPKINKLRPARYILVTSLQLSRQDKKKISNILQPYLQSQSDIFGAEDIEDALGRFESIEKKHYKLWFPSASVLIGLLNQAVIGRSDFSLGEMQRRLATYVETTDATKARAKLEALGVLVISGEPGVGKTTLASQLALESVAKNYELIVIEDDITEAESIYAPEKTQFFYFDDFLGRNFLEAIANKQDSQVLAFMRRVSADRSKRFVLTSRSNILNRGKQLSELFDLNGIKRNEFELIVGNISPLCKAQILYNHIWASDLGEDYIDVIYEDRKYRRIVRHNNFNPRLISFITDAERVSDITPNDFWSYIERTLDKPAGVWGHVFDRQLSDDCRLLVYLVVFNGRQMEEQQLSAAFARLANIVVPIEATRRFRDASKLGAGSVLTRSVLNAALVSYDLFNPSIADYVLSHVTTADEVTSILRALGSATAAENLWNLKGNNVVTSYVYEAALRGMADQIVHSVGFQDSVAVDIAEGMIRFDKFQEADSEFVAGVAMSIDSSAAESDLSSCLRVYGFVVARGAIEPTVEAVRVLVNAVASSNLELDELRLLRGVIDRLGEDHRLDLVDAFKLSVVASWEDNFDWQVRSDNVLSDFSSSQEIHAAREEIEGYLRDRCERINISLNASEIAHLCDSVEIEDILNDNLESWRRQFEDDDQEDSPPDYASEDELIDDYFDRSGGR